jgi:hypothetical protein
MTREDRGASSFDELASGLASGTLSRGKALRLMGAALVGGTLASLGIGEAGADNLCKQDGKKCRKDAQCCSRNCDDISGKCAAACPADTFELSNGSCAKRCTNQLDCPGGCGGCDPRERITGARYCRANLPPGGFCDTTFECPLGYFCGEYGSEGLCYPLC